MLSAQSRARVLGNKPSQLLSDVVHQHISQLVGCVRTGTQPGNGGNKLCTVYTYNYFFIFSVNLMR